MVWLLAIADNGSARMNYRSVPIAAGQVFPAIVGNAAVAVTGDNVGIKFKGPVSEVHQTMGCRRRHRCYSTES